MILYDKNSVFLGMSNQELYFLGYEDMEEFRNYCNDFADLFVNKPGYIFKFQNFSWIDYTLHSGTPNKKVLIRTKHGKEVETSLLITEIFLNKEINQVSELYCVELSTVKAKQEKSSLLTESDFSQTPPESFIPTPPYAEASPSPTPIAFSDDTTLLHADYTPSPEFEQEPEPIMDEPSPALQEPTAVASDFKLKFDNDILAPTHSSPTHLEYSSIDEIKPDDLSFESSQEAYHDDNNEDLQNDTNLLIETPPKEPEDAFDFSLIAEELGLEISLIAQIVNEYSDEMDNKMPLIDRYIQDNHLDLAQEEIEKLKSIALNLRITVLFHQFEHLEKSLRYDSPKEIQCALKNVNNAIARFKTNLQ